MKFKVVLVHEDGVLGAVLEDYAKGCKVVWTVDGITTESFLLHGEYTPITNVREIFND